MRLRDMATFKGRGSAIGYKRPPAHRQFVKGKCGNPKCRPKGTGVGNPLASLINQQLTVTVDGTPRKMLVTEALVTSLAQQALAGNIVAARDFMKIAKKGRGGAEGDRRKARAHRNDEAHYSGSQGVQRRP
jgi:hypothetical protein